MLISTAYAQSGGGGGDMVMQLLPLVLIFAVFWFFLIRPQQKRAKDHRAMVASVKRNDQVVTAGGIMAKIIKVIDDDTVQVEIADGVRVRVVKSTLTSVSQRGGQQAKAEEVREAPKGGGDGGSKGEESGGGGGGGGTKKPLFSFGGKK